MGRLVNANGGGDIAGPTPTIGHLRAFCAVVEHDGFGAAAEVLQSTQPAVSLHVRALERQYGLPLLQRLSRGVRLTEAGAAVYTRATIVLRELAALDEEMSALKGLRGGRLAIGASTTIANYVLPALIGAFKARYPDVTIALEVENTEAIAGAVAAHRLTLGFIEGPVPAPHAAALDVAPFRPDELVLVVAGTGPLAARASISLDELVALPFLAREPGSGTRKVIEEALRAAGASVRAYLELGHTEAIKTAVALGQGVSILSRHAVARECRAGELRILPIDGLRLERMLTAIVPRGVRPTPAEQAFLQLAGVF